MHQTVTAPVAASSARVSAIIGDLATYPDWLDLVSAVEPTGSADDRPTWLVTIRAKVGPFARSKKLRMVRTIEEHSDDRSTYRFERHEVDGRDHSTWTLDASVTPRPAVAEASPANAEASTANAEASTVTMDLRYEGGLWTAPLEPILGSFIDGAGPDLEAYANR